MASDAREKERQALESSHRRRVWLGLRLPFLALLLLCGAYVAALLLMPSPLQVALLTDSALLLFVLLPLALCLLPIMLLCIALPLLMLRLGARSPLRRLEGWTAALQSNAEVWLSGIDSRVLEWAVWLAPLRRLLTFFDPPEDSAEEGET